MLGDEGKAMTRPVANGELFDCVLPLLSLAPRGELAREDERSIVGSSCDCERALGTKALKGPPDGYGDEEGSRNALKGGGDVGDASRGEGVAPT